jgi:6-phosphogluconolactonase (cycloisomerase 2 family)
MISVLLITLNSFFSSLFADTTYELIIGSYTPKDNPGIEIFDFNIANGKASPSYTLKNSNSSYLALSPDGKNLFSVSENQSATASVSSFKLGSNNQFQSTGIENAIGAHPCFILYRASSGTIYTANYSGGSVSGKFCLYRSILNTVDQVQINLDNLHHMPIRSCFHLINIIYM